MEITFIECGTGDFIKIELENTDGSATNILIDSGYSRQAKDTLIPLLESYNKLDLWILTHTDRDHIGGIHWLLKNGYEDLIKEKVKQIWFNWSHFEVPPISSEITVEQGMLVRDKLKETGRLVDDDITTNYLPTKINNATIHILSPNPDSLAKYKDCWEKEEKKLTSQIGRSIEYHNTIETLLENEFKEDDSVWNGSSIGIVLEAWLLRYGCNI